MNKGKVTERIIRNERQVGLENQKTEFCVKRINTGEKCKSIERTGVEGIRANKKRMGEIENESEGQREKENF